MRNILFVSFILILLSACKTENDDQVVDFNDISKPSEKYKSAGITKDKKEVLTLYYDSLSVFSRQLVDSLGYGKDNIFKLDTLIFPDRFGPVATDKWYYRSASDSLVFMRWQFRYGSQTTFYNWLDCYGKNCKSIAVGDKVNFSRRATMLLNEGKELILIESGQKINGDKVLLVLEHLKKTKNWEYFVLQQPRGKAVWKSVNAEGEVLDYEIQRPVEEIQEVP